MSTLILIYGILSITKAYYVSPNVFTFDQGEYFCVNQCKSHLASIHNQSQFIEASKTINDSIKVFAFNSNVYIGLVASDNPSFRHAYARRSLSME